MKREIIDYIMDIKNECEYLLPRSASIDYETFISNEDLKKAFVRSLEVIGEAAKQIPDDIRNKYPMIPWKNIAGMRDILIHEYFGIDYRVVWKTVIERIPELGNIINEIIKDIQNNEGES